MVVLINNNSFNSLLKNYFNDIKTKTIMRNRRRIWSGGNIVNRGIVNEDVFLKTVIFSVHSIFTKFPWRTSLFPFFQPLRALDQKSFPHLVPSSYTPFIASRTDVKAFSLGLEPLHIIKYNWLLISLIMIHLILQLTELTFITFLTIDIKSWHWNQKLHNLLMLLVYPIAFLGLYYAWDGKYLWWSDTGISNFFFWQWSNSI